MVEKRIVGRVVQKHDIETNWQKATGFTPMTGEIIVYDIDNNHSYERFKIGDGIHNVNALPFVDDTLRDLISQKSKVQMITLDEAESITENLDILKIHKLTQEQYDEKLANGDIDETSIYLTPDEEIDLSGYATVDRVEQIGSLVGDTSVSDQINEALLNSQADWDQTDSTKPDYIKNKPDENDALELVSEMGLAEPVFAEDGLVYTDNNGVLYTL